MTEITVRGCYSTSRSPERATVHAAISYEGPASAPVYERVAGDLDTLAASISPILNPDGGAITRWSADQLRTWSNRPWHRDGSQLPLVYHARIEVKVEFSDFGALSAWIGGQVAAIEGFAVSTIEWTLIPTHREELQVEVRHRAVQDAVTRAQQYADALGLGPIRPVAVADAGMLSDIGSSADTPRTSQVRTAAALAGSGPEIELMPKDIELSVAVDARFVAGS
ncbi:MAG: SIMPL domain-containing protein [Actinomycetia bacterium]|nr:SIMPL domain-containing protein [Actinomycetes bacterium]